MTMDEARANIGVGVFYTAGHDGAPREDGVITSTSKSYVFVQFGTHGSKACRPEDLEFLS